MKLPQLNRKSFYQICENYFSLRNETVILDPLTELLTAAKREKFTNILDFLRLNEDIRVNFSYYLKNVFRGKAFNLSLTEAHILTETSFFPEFKKRILNKILPPVENEDTIWNVVENVSLTPKKDLSYFHNLKSSDLDALFKLLDINDFIDDNDVKKDLLFSLNILLWRVIGLAMDTDVVKMVPKYRNFDNPFLEIHKELQEINNDILGNAKFRVTSKNINYKQVKIYLKQCEDFVKIAFKNASKYGISRKINQSLLKIRQQLKRFSAVLDLLIIDQEEDVLIKSKALFINILEYKSHKNNIRELVGDSTLLLSHLITSHSAETGRSYISSTGKDYLKMLLKASGGGIIVGFLCVLKMLYSYAPGSDFLHAALYSFNYAMGFVMIYLMNFTLATKQPAMTAATMAQVLSEEKNTKKNYRDFAHLVSKLFRTQFIAFMGNVLLAFPVALLIIYGLEVLLNQNMAVAKSGKLIKDLDPVHSKAIFHACIAGFYLFISGIIAGNVSNNSVFYQIPKRILNNAFITKSFGKRAAKKISDYYSKNWPGITSNFWFGIFLGATGPVGIFFGLDLDIRHITFAAGNFALGLYGQNFDVTYVVFFTALSTVFIIGFFNFTVSFGLTMLLAFRSRKVNFGEIGLINREIFKYFLQNPFNFFLPLRSKLDKNANDMIANVQATKLEDR